MDCLPRMLGAVLILHCTASLLCGCLLHEASACALHFVDIAATNAYIMHCEVSRKQQMQPMTHKNFLSQLVSELCDVDKTGTPNKRSTQHVPVAIATAADASQKATQGRRTCQHCHQVDKKRNLTPWRCKACDVPLCVIVDRNCFEKWHK